MSNLTPLAGVIAPLLTPFENDLSIATELYVANAKRLLSEGCAGLAPFGTTGEALSIGLEERMVTLEALVEAGVPAEKLVPGTGLTSLPDTVRLTQHATDLGCAGAMVLPPFYFKNVSDDGLFDYFAALIAQVKRPELRLYLYHIPQVAGVGLPIPVVRRLREAFPESIVGIKDSSGNWENTCALMEIDGLIVYPGSEGAIVDAMDRGAPGCISATANLNAAHIAEVIATYHAGDADRARTLHGPVKAVRLAVQAVDFIQTPKRLFAKWSGDPRWATVRPPLVAADAQKADALDAELKSLGYQPPVLG